MKIYALYELKPKNIYDSFEFAWYTTHEESLVNYVVSRELAEKLKATLESEDYRNDIEIREIEVLEEC